VTDTFSWRTRKSAQGTESARTLQSQFGDGYKQIAGMGINDRSEVWELDWTGTRSEAAVLRAFLMSHITKSFWWTNPWGEKKLYRMKADSFSVSFPSGKKATVAFTFEQSFAL
jgi:Phage-related protein